MSSPAFSAQELLHKRLEGSDVWAGTVSGRRAYVESNGEHKYYSTMYTQFHAMKYFKPKPFNHRKETKKHYNADTKALDRAKTPREPSSAPQRPQGSIRQLADEQRKELGDLRCLAPSYKH